MSSKFRYFDPTKDRLPFGPFNHANTIAWRARSILKGRSREQIVDIAGDIDAILESYFDQERLYGIKEVKAAGRHDLLKTDEDGNVCSLEDEAYEEFNIRNSDNTPELYALQEAIHDYFDPSALGIENLSEHEYFAVFALTKLDDYFTQYEYEFDMETLQRKKRNNRNLSIGDLSLMGDYLLDAIEAINYSEKKKEIERISQRYETQIRDIKDNSEASLEKKVNEVRSEIHEENEKIRKEQSKAGNEIRHALNRSIKKMVLDWFDEDPRKFVSAEKAADEFNERLLDQNLNYAHRTIADWVRKHARERGIRFRP